MTTLLLAESVPQAGSVLVIGAGGGLELNTFAEAHATWRFVGVDPSAEMLKLARTNLAQHLSRIQLHEGYTDTAPEGPYDGATCLLTLHFLTLEDRRNTLREVHRRLRPGAPFVVAHHSFPQAEPEKKRWLDRYAAFAIASGVSTENATNAAAAISRQLPVLAPEQEEALLRETGFNRVELFYAGFSFRGWVAYSQA